MVVAVVVVVADVVVVVARDRVCEWSGKCNGHYIIVRVLERVRAGE